MIIIKELKADLNIKNMTYEVRGLRIMIDSEILKIK